MPLTLEERERRAYIANSPDHPLLVEAIDAETEVSDELRHERDRAQQEAKDAGEEVEKLEGELEIAENRIEKLEGELAEATKTIESAGLDLV
jgi:predicted  nucleic acid-binding Zn-ribbon protein